MSNSANPGMDADIFDQFLEQLERYVRERLIPAEKQVIADDKIPDEIVEEMKEMGLFGLTVPEDNSAARASIATQYARRSCTTMSYAAPAFRSIFSINVGMFNSAIKNGGTDANRRPNGGPSIAAGEIACFGLTEPGSGSRQRRDADHRQTRSGRQWLDPQRDQALHHQRAARRMSGLIMARTEKDASAQERACQRVPGSDGRAGRIGGQRRSRRWASPAATSPTSCSTT